VNLKDVPGKLDTTVELARLMYGMSVPKMAPPPQMLNWQKKFLDCLVRYLFSLP
jgi:hypothetical protein